MPNVLTAAATPMPVMGGLGFARHQRMKGPGEIAKLPISLVLVPVAEVIAGGVVGTPYSETISVQGGTPAYTFSVSSGSLPAGLSLNASTGVISGTPTTAATSAFTITATDSASITGFQPFQITIANPSGGSGSSSYGWVG